MLPPDTNTSGLNKLFNLPAEIPGEQNAIVVREDSEMKSMLENDFDEARENIKNIAEIGQIALIEMAKIAKIMEQPRGYDALSKLMGAAIMAQKATLEIHKNRQDVDDNKETQPHHVTNNNLILTTAEFQQRMMEIRSEIEASNSGIHDTSTEFSGTTIDNDSGTD